MEWSTIVLSILGGGTVGGFFSSLITVHYERKKLLYETKLPAYTNFIRSLEEMIKPVGDYEIKYSQFLAYKKSVELIGSDDIFKSCKEYTEDVAAIRDKKIDEIVIKMREDLQSYQGWCS